MKLKSIFLASLALVALLVPAASQQLNLIGTLKDTSSGATYNVTISPDVTTTPPPTTEPPAVEPPPPTTEPVASGTIPLTYSAAQFNGNTVASSTTVASGGTIKNKTITDTGQTASIVTRDGGATIDNVRIKSREGVRVGGGGAVTIKNSYIEVNGTGTDHADGIQTYTPGSKGTLKLLNTTLKTGTDAATAGLFVADGYGGTVDLENVAIIGGPYGARIHADGGGSGYDIDVKFKNVYVVGPFKYDGLWVDGRVLNGSRNHIVVWDGVWEATIVNGQLVKGKAIPKPSF